jgi:PAS domain S-box-containing protein
LSETVALAQPDFKRLFEASASLYIVLNPECKVLAVSDAYAAAAKLPRESILGRNFFELFPQANDPETKRALQKIVKTKKADPLTIKIYDSQNPDSPEIKYWGIMHTPVLDNEGEVEYIIRRAEDMTDMVVQQNESRNVQQERDLLFSHSIDLMAVVGSDGYFKRVNPAFERVLGFTPYEMYAKPVVEFLHRDDRTKTAEGIGILAKGQARLGSINRYMCKDGTYRTFAWNSNPLGEKFYTVGRDITELVEAKQKIQDLNEQLQRKNEELEKKVEQRALELAESHSQVLQLQKLNAIGRLAGGIAHDFNNILGVISLYSDLIETNPENKAKIPDYIKNIKAATVSATALTRQLLIFSRKQIVQSQVINANDKISNLEKMLRRLIGENIQVELKLSQDLKNIKIDPSQFEQIILNLVVNSRDAMPRGGKLTIETKMTALDDDKTNYLIPVKAGNYVCVSIMDSGEGMDATTLSKVFEPFFTTKDPTKGTGLGLSTTFGIVQQNEGTLWAYSEPKRGTIFKIYLPVSDEKLETAAAGTEVAKGEILQGTETVLLVEDSESLNRGFVSVLEAHGYKVFSASNGTEALQVSRKYKDVKIDLILTDMVMPGMSGLELADQIKKERPNARVLFMSGYANETFEDRGPASLQEYEFLQKPFGVSELLLKIKSVMKAN